jgi:polyhydroxybutyrate depolymerase
LEAGDQTVPLQSGGSDRPFLLYVPKGYDGKAPLPLLLNLHGSGGDGPGQMETSQMRGYADNAGFLVAAPNGGAIAGAGHAWVVPGSPPRGDAPPGGYPDDVKYLREVIAKVQAVACQNRAKVFVAGHSGGGRMASAMGCNAADVITAIVANVGLRAGAPRTSSNGVAEPDPATCNPSRPLPVIAVHGTKDGTNPYDGGGQPDWQYTVPQAVARWAELLGCHSAETVTSFSPTIDQISHSGCRGYSSITLYRVNGGEHVWFDGEIKTSELVTAMIARYSLRVPRLNRFNVACRNGNIRVRVTAVTDAPLTSLTVKNGGRRRTFTNGTASVTFKPASRRSKVLVTATDKAGLTGSRTRQIRCP